MDLISWSLKAIDKNITRHVDLGEATCSDGKFAKGYVMDSWERWRIARFLTLSVEDVYIFTTLIIVLTLIGFGFILIHTQLQQSSVPKGCLS